MGFLRFGLIFLAASWLTKVMAIEPNVVVARVDFPGASPERIERDVAIPLERVLEKLQGVKAVKSRCDEGMLTVEVSFTGPAGNEELARVAMPVHEFKAVTPSPIGTPSLALEPASLL